MKTTNSNLIDVGPNAKHGIINTTKRARKPAKKTYLMFYAYDVPHYAQFTIQAGSEDEARAIAQAALDNGKFDDVVGEPSQDGIDGHGVFCMRQADQVAEKHIGPMTELAGFGDNPNAAQHKAT